MTRLLSIVALLIILIFGARAIEQRGYDRRDAEAKLEHARMLVVQEQTLAKNRADAHARDKKLTTQLEEQGAEFDRRTSILTAHLTKQANARKKTTHENPSPSDPAAGTPADSNPVLLGAAVLDEFTVRLLDDARANRPSQVGDPASPSDEEIRATATPSAVTGAAFAENDLAVVKKYHDLAARHDTLVDWVNHQCVDPARNPTSP